MESFFKVILKLVYYLQFQFNLSKVSKQSLMVFHNDIFFFIINVVAIYQQLHFVKKKKYPI